MRLIDSAAERPRKPSVRKEMSSFKFDFDERKLRRDVEKAAQQGVNDVAKELTHDMERLRLQYRGRPADSIKPALKRLFERRGGKITEPELTQYAEMISGGTKIEFKPEQVKF
jgi:hypothetical protein